MFHWGASNVSTCLGWVGRPTLEDLGCQSCWLGLLLERLLSSLFDKGLLLEPTMTGYEKPPLKRQKTRCFQPAAGIPANLARLQRVDETSGHCSTAVVLRTSCPLPKPRWLGQLGLGAVTGSLGPWLGIGLAMWCPCDHLLPGKLHLPTASDFVLPGF